MKAIDKIKQIRNDFKNRNNTLTALDIKLIEQTAVYRYMDELSAQGYDFINPPKL